jgi:Flp pilus assembly protein TadD
MQTSLSNTPDSLHQRLQAATRLHQQGLFDEAEDLYRGLLADSPEHPEILRLLGLLKHQAGDPELATGLLQRAIEAGSDDGRAMEALGCILGETGKTDEAIRCLQQVTATHPGQGSAFFNLGMILTRDPLRLDEATEALQRAVELDQSNNRAQSALARVLLCRRQPENALVPLEKVLARNPGDVHSLAHKTAALSQLGDMDGVAELADLETLLHFDYFKGGSGFQDAAELNQKLAEYILGHPTLGTERTTSNGMDTGEIFDSKEPAIQALSELVASSVARMMDSLTLPEGHPFPASQPQRCYLSGWGVRMWRGGFQIPHYHKEAWISGVYYVRLPAVISDSDAAQQGWIEFGRGPDDIFHDSAPQTRRIQPEEGKLIAFPSYIWHRTLPFDDDGERLCISFNVVPADY